MKISEWLQASLKNHLQWSLNFDGNDRIAAGILKNSAAIGTFNDMNMDEWLQASLQTQLQWNLQRDQNEQIAAGILFEGSLLKFLS